MESRFSICPGGCRLNGPVCVEPVSPRIGESCRRADGPRCAHAFVADARLVCRHARHHCFIGGTLVLGVWRVWFESTPRKKRGKGELPPWPISPSDEKPAIVVGETHHPVEAREVPNPDWLVIPERGLYTGVAIFGAVGSGKTSACMHPFARQLFGWQARNPKRRAAALILEVKGDFCYDIREILKRRAGKTITWN